MATAIEIKEPEMQSVDGTEDTKKAKAKSSKKDKVRVSMTFSTAQHDMLTALAKRYSKSPTTFCFDLTCERLVKAIDDGEIEDKTVDANEALTEMVAFVTSIIDEKDLPNDRIEKIAGIVGKSKEELLDVFFWEPENEQEL